MRLGLLQRIHENTCYIVEPPDQSDKVASDSCKLTESNVTRSHFQPNDVARSISMCMANRCMVNRLNHRSTMSMTFSSGGLSTRVQENLGKIIRHFLVQPFLPVGKFNFSCLIVFLFLVRVVQYKVNRVYYLFIPLVVSLPFFSKN